MLSRAEIIKILLAYKSKDFQEEVNYHMTIDDREYEYDELSALFDIKNAADIAGDTQMKRISRKLLLDIGFYRIMTQEEIDGTIRSDGRVAWEFKHLGVPYTSDYTEEEWQWPPDTESDIKMAS